MPTIAKLKTAFIGLMALLMAHILMVQPSCSKEGIGLYYLRYDIKSSNNRIVDTSLVMIPADNDFRAENFTTISARGSITAVPGDSMADMVNQARKSALKQVLEKNGLKSVSTASSIFSNKTSGIDTVLSYEGAMIPPMEMVESTYDSDTNCFSAVFRISFSPLDFPDKWRMLQMKTKIKQALNNFISLF